MVRLMNATLEWPNPIYIRLAKGGDPVVSRDENGFAIGKAIPMRRARSRRAVGLLATGGMTLNSPRAAGRRRPDDWRLRQRGDRRSGRKTRLKPAGARSHRPAGCLPAQIRPAGRAVRGPRAGSRPDCRAGIQVIEGKG